MQQFKHIYDIFSLVPKNSKDKKSKVVSHVTTSKHACVALKVPNELGKNYQLLTMFLYCIQITDS